MIMVGRATVGGKGADKIYNGETLQLMCARWKKLASDFYSTKKGKVVSAY